MLTKFNNINHNALHLKKKCFVEKMYFNLFFSKPLSEKLN